MQPFTTHTGTIAVLADDNIDTDRIIPARYLSRVSRSGYGELLFIDSRKEDFPLNRKEAEGATILVVGANFGCGSSREHAVWAIQQAGFRCVIARATNDTPGFSDIFRQNAANCGLLLVELPPNSHEKLVAAGSGSTVTVDLPRQLVVIGGEQLHFDIAPSIKQTLVEGLDLIGTTLKHEAEIEDYERRHDAEIRPARSA